MRAGRDTDRAQIANGPSLKIGMRDPRVPHLRARLDVAGEGGATYDKPLADAVNCAEEAGRKYIAAASHVLPGGKVNGCCG